MSKRLTENKPSDTPVTAARPVKNTDTLPRRIASWLGLLLLIAFPESRISLSRGSVSRPLPAF